VRSLGKFPLLELSDRRRGVPREACVDDRSGEDRVASLFLLQANAKQESFGILDILRVSRPLERTGREQLDRRPAPTARQKTAELLTPTSKAHERSG
jgi:hypothetical protein